MSNLIYRIVYYLIRFAGLLPPGVLYFISDLIYYLIYYVIRYRRQVVNENLRNSFPEKSTAEIRHIARNYYRHLCDLIVESLYQTGMSEEEISLRVRYNNPEIIQKYFDRGKHVAAVLGHYGNWEWLCGFPLITPYKCITIYRPLNNRVFDRLMLEARSRFGAEPVPMKMAIRKIYEYDKLGIPSITAFIADQTPPMEKSIFWVDFFNRDTPVYSGVERIAKKMDMAVLFFKMKKTGRGYYEFDLIPLFDNASETTDYEITKAHVAFLEQQIREQPEYWLWSHRRWKLKRNML